MEDILIYSLSGVCAAGLCGIITYGILWRIVTDVTDIAEVNARGTHFSNWEAYSKSEIEGTARLELQEEMYEHAHGNPFYCNSFTGWRKKLYHYAYFRALKKNKHSLSQKAVIEKQQQEAEHLKQEKQKRITQKEAKRVENLQLRTLTLNNMREVKN